MSYKFINSMSYRGRTGRRRLKRHDSSTVAPGGSRRTMERAGTGSRSPVQGTGDESDWESVPRRVDTGPFRGDWTRLVRGNSHWETRVCVQLVGGRGR